MSIEITTARLADHPDALPVLIEWFKSEWPAWYGPGRSGCAENDLAAYANWDDLPVGVVAFRNGALCGFAALKAESIPSHAHLMPWAAAGLVRPSLRGQGIGAVLLAALEREAKSWGYARIYCGTATAGSLLLRAQWRLIDCATLDGVNLGIYEKLL